MKPCKPNHRPWCDSCVEGGDGEIQSTGKLKNSFTAGFEKLIKSLSQYFVLYQGEDKEVGMEIGFLTDVEHAAPIGREGFDSPEFLSFSLKQFELAMVAHVGASPPHGPHEVLLT